MRKLILNMTASCLSNANDKIYDETLIIFIYFVINDHMNINLYVFLNLQQA